MSNGNGHGQAPVAFETRFGPSAFPPHEHEQPAGELRQERRPFLLALVLFLLTVLSTLAVGTEFAQAYAANRAPFTRGFGFFFDVWNEPALLLGGLPFSFTLLGILLAHELGHYFACRYYHISASYPYFIPAPTIIGTMGAFIRIRSPIVNRTALFDVGLAGPVVGFLFAVPALAIALVHSKVMPAGQMDTAIVFGSPLLERLLTEFLRPGIAPQDIFLHPVGRAAWVGLFATALNLLPAGQLDGGHIVYALASEKHRHVSLAVALLLIPMGFFFWGGWGMWAALLLVLGFRHPRLLDRWEPLDQRRRIWALIALVILLLCFIPVPIR
jgi:membrane-associated protease RseP (regulator of RpoE activity)